MDKEKVLTFIDKQVDFLKELDYDDRYAGMIDGLLMVKKFIEEKTKGEDE